MNPLSSLLETYQLAEKSGLVDQHLGETDPILLPIFHDSKKSKGEDAIEVLLNEKGEFLGARFFPKDVYLEFPVSELSIGRSSGVAPHPLVDKLLYLSKSISVAQKKEVHHQVYLEQLETWAKYETTHPQPLLRSIVTYLLNPDNDIFQDILPALFGQDYRNLGGGYVEQIVEKKSKKYNFAEIFASFSVEFSDPMIGTRTVTKDRDLHQHHIQHILEGLKDKDPGHCDISGEEIYLTSKHRGLMGNAKVVGESNHYEVYRGRFSNGSDLIHIGLINSQKIFLMLKYFLENKDNGHYLNSGSYLINWFNHDIKNENNFQPDNLNTSNNLLTGMPTSEQVSEPNYNFGGMVAKKFATMICGNGKFSLDEISYQIMLLEKTSNGRIAIKYFRKFPGSQLAENLGHWYQSLGWPVYKMQEQAYSLYVPPIFGIVNTLYGEEQENSPFFTILGDRNKAIAGHITENLISSVMERKPIPADLAAKAGRNAKNRSHYKKHWPIQFQMDCIILQKYLKDLPQQHPKHLKEDKNLAYLDETCSERSYLYGRLLAVYDKIEKDAQFSRKSAQTDQKEISQTNPAYDRETNAARLWTAFMDRPTIINRTLSTKIQPYLSRLKALKPKTASYYEKLMGELISRIYEAKKTDSKEALDEMFLFGYYGQTQAFYQNNKKDNNKEENQNAEDIKDMQEEN